MKEGFSWTKLTDKERLDYGIWIAICTMSVVVSTLFGVIISLNNERKEIQKSQDLEISFWRKRDSIEIASWKVKYDNLATRYTTSLETKEIKLNALQSRTDSLYIKVNEKK